MRPLWTGGAPPEGGPWAHSANAEGEWHDLRDHLESVAKIARGFAEPFGAGALAEVVGWWHDVGKFQHEFQEMLREVQAGRPKRRVDHSATGAVHARSVARLLGRGHPGAVEPLVFERLMAFVIAAHHAGLADSLPALDSRLDERSAAYQAVRDDPRAAASLGLPRGLPELPSRLTDPGATDTEQRLRCEFLIRMLLSAVVDADRLDTESFREAGLPKGTIRSSSLRGAYSPIPELCIAVDRDIDTKVASLNWAEMTSLEACVNSYRQEVLLACRNAAEMDAGAFTLDVATGGGKTLASLSFALRHATKHGKGRVIVVIPFTSIIDQTARAYREALGELAFNVLEHHSALDLGLDDEGQDPSRVRARLATENWDAPIIVTTGVQFFESLFARSASRCRKLHNIANSVVVLDEAQTLPPELLHPTVWAINEMVEGYKVSVVVSTATQPALERPFPEVQNLRPIVNASVKRPPERVRVEIVGQEATACEDLARELAALPQALCITHLRNDARELTLAVDRVTGDEDTIHLSAAMCAAHRDEVIHEIKRRLTLGQPCRVISTQLVEAGVDLDFPVVYRALGGVDAMVQAAGRANREGRLGERGGVLHIYAPPTKPPSGLPRIGAGVAEAMLKAAALDGHHPDLLSPEMARDFFHRYYASIGDMDRGIRALREEFQFGGVEKRYRFVGDAGDTVIVPFAGDVVTAVTEARSDPIRSGALRRLQRFTVSVYPHQLRRLAGAGALEPLFQTSDPQAVGPYLLRRNALYSQRFGLSAASLEQFAPDEAII